MFDINDSYYEKFVDEPIPLAPISPEIIEAYDTDDDFDDEFVDNDCDDAYLEEEGGESDLDISKIEDIVLREKLIIVSL